MAINYTLPRQNQPVAMIGPGGAGRMDQVWYRFFRSLYQALGNGQARGAVALRGGKCDQIRVGSLIKVEGFGLHPSGLIREPRPCKDTPTSWLIQF